MVFLELSLQDYWEIQSVLEAARRKDLIRKLIKAREEEEVEEEELEVEVDEDGFWSLR
jgi:hypothetical protein